MILSAGSGLDPERQAFVLDLPFADEGWSPWSPDYVLATPEFAPGYMKTPFVMYLPSRRIRARGGVSLGQVYDPWFNRGFRHFCSHQHAPYRTEPSGFDAGVMTDNVLYFAHPVFSIYRGFGMVYLQEFVVNALRRFLGAELQVETSLPTTGRVTFFDQPEEKRAVLHLLYANTVNRGGGGLHLLNQPHSNGYAIEVIEELLPLANVKVSVKPPRPVRSVRFVPQGEAVPFVEKNGRIEFTVPELLCHQMVEFAY